MILAAKPIFRFKLRLVKLPVPGSINAKGKRAVYSVKIPKGEREQSALACRSSAVNNRLFVILGGRIGRRLSARRVDGRRFWVKPFSRGPAPFAEGAPPPFPAHKGRGPGNPGPRSPMTPMKSKHTTVYTVPGGSRTAARLKKIVLILFKCVDYKPHEY